MKDELNKIAEKYKGTKFTDEAIDAILELFNKQLPEKLDLKMNKYHHQTQIDGYNQCLADIKSRIE